MRTEHVIEISISSIIKFILVLLALWFIFIVRDIIAIVFASVIIAATFSPVIDRMAQRGIPRGLTVLLTYILMIGLLGGVIYFVVPPLVGQLRQLAEQLPSYFAYLNNFTEHIRDLGVENDLINGTTSTSNTITEFLNNVSSNIFSTTRGFISGFTALLTVFILSLYLLVDEDGIKKFFVALLPVKQKHQLVNVGNKIGMGLGNWLRGQMILGLAIGVIVYIGLTILGVPYALTLAILAAIFEIIPVIGPIISAIPAILIALNISPTTALLVAGFYILVQELENKLLVPKVMQKTVGLHPVTIIIVLLIGAKLMGVLGMLLAVPVTTMVHIILKEWTAVPKAIRKAA